MKKYLLILCLCFAGLYTKAQTDTTQVETYCTLNYPSNGIIKNAAVVDFGGGRVETLREPNVGKPKTFTSAVDALNYMALKGWKLVSVYPAAINSINDNATYNFTTRYLMKKLIPKP